MTERDRAKRRREIARAFGIRQYELPIVGLAVSQAGAPIDVFRRLDHVELYKWFFRAPVVDAGIAVRMMVQRRRTEREANEAARVASVVVDLAAYRRKS